MSSSSLVCQGLQPCMEPGRFVDPRLPLLDMAPWASGFPRSPSPADPLSAIPTDVAMGQEGSASDEKAEETQNTETRGWSFLQSIICKPDPNGVYMHPLLNSASGKLSNRSLEMCTEGLGSETGNSVIESSEEISLLWQETCPKKEALRARDVGKGRRGKGSSRVAASFPPLIRSMSGAGGGVRVKPHREGGRLVLEAVSVSPSVSCFHVERSEGRLRLCLLRDPLLDSEEEKSKMLGATLGRTPTIA